MEEKSNGTLQKILSVAEMEFLDNEFKKNDIKKTKEIFPDYKIVVTTGTKTGQEIAQKKYKDIADFILTYDGDDYIPCVSLDPFGDEMFCFVKYIEHNKENIL